MEFSKDRVVIKFNYKSFDINDTSLFHLNHIPKIIFKDKRFKSVSYVDIDFNEHQIKRRFRGQTYIAFKVIQTFDDNGSIRLKMASKDFTDYNALVMVSKREIRTTYPNLRIANKQYVYQQAERISEEFLKDYENLLNGNIFSISIEDKNDNSLSEVPMLITDYKNFAINLLTNMCIMSARVALAIKEMINTEEFKEMFNNVDRRIIFNNEKE